MTVYAIFQPGTQKMKTVKILTLKGCAKAYPKPHTWLHFQSLIITGATSVTSDQLINFISKENQNLMYMVLVEMTNGKN